MEMSTKSFGDAAASPKNRWDSGILDFMQNSKGRNFSKFLICKIESEAGKAIEEGRDEFMFGGGAELFGGGIWKHLRLNVDSKLLRITHCPNTPTLSCDKKSGDEVIGIAIRTSVDDTLASQRRRIKLTADEIDAKQGVRYWVD
ncbi:uncharacterized protein EV420DRAFT_1480364 [Desarmillaria tabescens]|uniref:Uncharacterized protein n=1 Tax=Armillaria tabescens TaxID=1929756 RepID=A0AA39N540_ARMTA|nr:uncharacterized protein EV420DRAFT_1480364 [Desarmillaria tabescens]KAK0457744.1 hypothetical protein EV420DRAFT_1480364 [Desarmillaria tabescens]